MPAPAHVLFARALRNRLSAATRRRRSVWSPRVRKPVRPSVALRCGTGKRVGAGLPIQPTRAGRGCQAPASVGPQTMPPMPR